MNSAVKDRELPQSLSVINIDRVEKDATPVAASSRSSEESSISDPRYRDHNSKPEIDSPHEFMAENVVDRMFIKPTIVALVVWLALLGLVYGIAPEDYWEFLDPAERSAATFAMTILVATEIILLIPVVLRPKQQLSGIVFASATVHFVSCATNALLAFFPVVTLVDPITGARVFLIRWCEWIPLAGLMTFLSEGIGLKKSRSDVRKATFVSMCQSLSCLAGPLLPLAPSFDTWKAILAGSIMLWITMFPRLWSRATDLMSMPKGNAFKENDRHNRAWFSYYLILACTIAWTLFVLAYFLNSAAHSLLPEEHILRVPGLSMWADVIVEVAAKAVYMRILLDVHRVVFDQEYRSHCQLHELRRLMSVLWYSSTDAILVSVHQRRKQTIMFSPSFLNLVGCTFPDAVPKHVSAALLVEIESSDDSKHPTVLDAYYIDSLEIPTENEKSTVLAEVDMDSPVVLEALQIVTAIQNQPFSDHKLNSSTFVHNVRAIDSHERHHCEIKVSQHDVNSFVAVIRDATERVNHYEAERKAHLESFARQENALAVNRFTRHEVKNGLLTGLELCDTLRHNLDLVQKTTRDQGSTVECESHLKASYNSVNELDEALREALDTVLDGALARELVEETYSPRFERVDVSTILKSSVSGVGYKARFPLQVHPRRIPAFSLDSQLIRYIHRNAISNACKYGKLGGVVMTRIKFNESTSSLEIQVINEPGEGHAQLRKLGNAGASKVFQQGTRLHCNLEGVQDNHISSGDGAWIIQKCAHSLGGECSINFEKDHTVFTFSCQPTVLVDPVLRATESFAVPKNTWGVGIDDSKVQRKMLNRILTNCGVLEERKVVIGGEPSDIRSIGERLAQLLREDPQSKVLVLVDENLDYLDTEAESVVLSGSLCVKKAFDTLSNAEQDRVLVVVRSANDSTDDLLVFSKRTHGFLPKAPMNKRQLQEIVAPIWARRFPSVVRRSSCSPDLSNGECHSVVTVTEHDLRQSLQKVVAIIEEHSETSVAWTCLWRTMHSLKGDLVVMEETIPVKPAIAMIESMRNYQSVPDDLKEKWERIEEMVSVALDDMGNGNDIVTSVFC